MRQVTIPLAAALAATLLPGAAASAEPGQAQTGDRAAPASVRVVQCLRGPAPEGRLAVFRGAMRRVPGSDRMSMRFKLQERVGDGMFRTVRAPGLGTWRRSRQGVTRFAYRQRVLALAEGSSYRVIVDYRWYSADGEVIRRARRRSSSCRQPGLLADLRVTRISVARPEPALPGAYRYAVSVVNRGRIAAEGFGVSLAVDGGTVDTQAVSALTPGESRRLVFSGPACRSTVTAVADSADSVREASERDNTFMSRCPLFP